MEYDGPIFNNTEQLHPSGSITSARVALRRPRITASIMIGLLEFDFVPDSITAKTIGFIATSGLAYFGFGIGIRMIDDNPNIVA